MSALVEVTMHTPAHPHNHPLTHSAHTHTYKCTETQNHSTQTILWCVFLNACMCMCLCVGLVGTCACNDPRSGCVTTCHVLRRSDNFTPPFSVTIPTAAVCLLTWCYSIFTEYSLITTLTEQLQSLLAAAMGN